MKNGCMRLTFHTTVCINTGLGSNFNSKVYTQPQASKYKKLGDVVAPTSEAVVPGSNPASLTVENSENRQGHCVVCNIPWEISVQRG